MKKASYTTAVVGKWHLKDSPRYFDFFSVIAGQGSYMNPTMHTSEGGTKRRIRFDSTLEREIEVIDTQGHSSDVLTDISLEWLENRDRTKPFFLMHHFKAPHDMFVYAPRYENYLKDTHIPEPDNLYDQPGCITIKKFITAQTSGAQCLDLREEKSNIEEPARLREGTRLCQGRRAVFLVIFWFS